MPVTHSLYLLGDINLKGIADPSRIFDVVGPDLTAADMVFANLECCLFDDAERAVEKRGFYVPTRSAALLRDGGVQVVGAANNVNIGAEAIASSLAALASAGIAQVGAGLEPAAAYRTLVVERNGLRYGFLQRTAVYWPDGHEVGIGQPGVAVIKAHTAYRPRYEQQAARTRPGVPPEVVTWADPDSLAEVSRAVAELRTRADIVIASFHWGYRREVLQYQRQFARAAIDTGADIVLGHGPHMIMPLELHAGRPIIYGGGNFSFLYEHGNKPHADWVGMFVHAEIVERSMRRLTISFVRRDASDRTIVRSVRDEPRERDELIAASAANGAALTAEGDRLVLQL
ncbi:CapA family protein [Bradyrhizobium sp. CCGB01]|uniref:CapA family protein n=1 Tax=Bradyrhizobium sp. CCGB01 TaxID=2949634 RepID=UPI0020B4253B|nr:CapA family protein [Bradyrhizobium sp. CCGB01]MCP3404561.1 CapA family protein [Bradyrhizobium sp. CCGB01]